MTDENDRGEAKLITAIRTGEVVRVSHAERRKAQQRGRPEAKQPKVEFTNRIKGLNAIDPKELPRGRVAPRAKR